MKPAGILAVTPGDPDGIGPEIVWKTIRKRGYPGSCRLLVVGAKAPFTRLRAPVVEVTPDEIRAGTRPPRSARPFVWLLPAPTEAPRGRFLPGFQSGWAIETATRLVLGHRADALVTGPISKERLNAGGYAYPGHTEFLSELCDAGEVTMMLANEQIRVSLVTTHVALGAVPAALNAAKIIRAVLQTGTHLRRWWGIRKPRIAVAALNPHAGEGGMFGDEEGRIIAPAIAECREIPELRDCAILGPLPADTLFANQRMSRRADRFDAVVCMYHDQGLIPVKQLDFQNTVNITLGLPIVRTSVDHGTGFDIAGKGKADPSSFQAAVRLAARLGRATRA